MDAIYLDNNASTPLLPSVWQAMQPYFTDISANPASSHRPGQKARRALEDAREKIASLLDAHPDELIFTSGATEANNLALFGLVVTAFAPERPAHIVSSPLEHPCVTEPIRRLVEQGFSHDLLPVTQVGVVRTEGLIELVRPQTCLIAVMLANHETGAIQPIEELTRMAGNQVPFHCDAAAAAGKVAISFRELGVTTLTISAHKFHGPKGIGGLLVRRHTKLRPSFWGGHQQQGRRPGTEPVALAVGMAAALESAMHELTQRREKVLRLRQRLIEALRAGASPVVLNGPEEGGIPHTINLSFPGCPADVLLMNLDLAGVACSTGSACSSGSLLPSPVLKAMGVPEDVLHSAMRFSLSPLLREDEIEEAARRIGRVVARLRTP